MRLYMTGASVSAICEERAGGRVHRQGCAMRHLGRYWYRRSARAHTRLRSQQQDHLVDGRSAHMPLRECRGVHHLGAVHGVFLRAVVPPLRLAPRSAAHFLPNSNHPSTGPHPTPCACTDTQARTTAACRLKGVGTAWAASSVAVGLQGACADLNAMCAPWAAQGECNSGSRSFMITKYARRPSLLPRRRPDGVSAGRGIRVLMAGGRSEEGVLAGGSAGCDALRRAVPLARVRLLQAG